MNAFNTSTREAEAARSLLSLKPSRTTHRAPDQPRASQLDQVSKTKQNKDYPLGLTLQNKTSVTLLVMNQKMLRRQKNPSWINQEMVNVKYWVPEKFSEDKAGLEPRTIRTVTAVACLVFTVSQVSF